VERMTAQIGALPGDGGRLRFFGLTAPRIVMACGAGSVGRSAWTSTSATASSIVSATATHPQEQDIAHGAAMAPLLPLRAITPVGDCVAAQTPRRRSTPASDGRETGIACAEWMRSRKQGEVFYFAPTILLDVDDLNVHAR
jgi:hypothetical protein